MAETQQKMLIAVENTYGAIVIDAGDKSNVAHGVSVRRICWNTGEEKNCLACYLRLGCKAK
jgi:hypothetical protein